MGRLQDMLVEKFRTLQVAGSIAESLFEPGLSSDTISTVVTEVQRKRVSIRNKMTKSAELFDGVEERIPSLAQRYYLAIVSATDEKIIRDYLRGKDVLEYFSHVYGKHAPDESWSEHIAIKAQNWSKNVNYSWRVAVAYDLHRRFAWRRRGVKASRY